MHDLVVRNGQLVDGTGGPPRWADVAVDGDRIVAVGDDVGAAHRVIDADGRLVTPGWVDVHTHYDAQVSWDPLLTPSSWHGVTTVVMGNCGVGFAPAAPDRREWLIELMEGVEDIPGSAMVEGITWDWETYPEYLDAIERQPRVLDVGSQIGHGPLRAYVMGERGAANEPATTADIAEMARLVEAALHAGALGFSTSRTPIHRSKAGELVPGTTAAADELLGIGDALRRAGHGVFQFAPDHLAVPTKEWGWMSELARRTGRTVSVNLNQPDDGPDVWRDVLTLLDEARAEGVPIVAQAAGRSIGILMCLHGSLHPLMFHPAYHEIAFLPMAERLVALRDPDRQRRFVDEVPGDDLYRKAVTERFAADVPGRRRRHRLRADRRTLCRRAGGGAGQAAHAARPRPAPRPRRQRDAVPAVLQLRLRRPVVQLRAPAPPGHADGTRATPVPTAARSATAARPRSCSRTGRATAAEGRASRSNTSCIARPGRPPSCTGCSTGG